MFASTSTRPFTLHLPLRPEPSQPPSSPQSPQSPRSPSPLPLPEFPSPSATAYKPHLAADYVAGSGSTFADGLKENDGEKNKDGEEVNTWPFEAAAATRGAYVGAAMLLPDTEEEGGIALALTSTSEEEEVLSTTTNNSNNNKNKREDTAAEAYARAHAEHMAGLIASYIDQNGDVLQPHT